MLIGPAEWLGAVLNEFDEWSTRHVISIVATSLFYAAAGAVFGWQAQLLRRAETDIADRRARDDVARVLHDTVLQTLALVERRSADSRPRSRPHGPGGRPRAPPLPVRPLRSLGRHIRAAGTCRRRPGGEHHDATEVAISVGVLDNDRHAPDAIQEAVAAAIGEAVANALEHADSVTCRGVRRRRRRRDDLRVDSR